MVTYLMYLLTYYDLLLFIVFFTWVLQFNYFELVPHIV